MTSVKLIDCGGGTWLTECRRFAVDRDRRYLGRVGRGRTVTTYAISDLRVPLEKRRTVAESGTMAGIKEKLAKLIAEG